MSVEYNLDQLCASLEHVSELCDITSFRSERKLYNLVKLFMSVYMYYVYYIYICSCFFNLKMSQIIKAHFIIIIIISGP